MTTLKDNLRYPLTFTPKTCFRKNLGSWFNINNPFTDIILGKRFSSNKCIQLFKHTYDNDELDFDIKLNDLSTRND